MESKEQYVRAHTTVSVERDYERDAVRIRFVYRPGDTDEVYGMVEIVSEADVASRFDFWGSFMDELMTRVVEEFVHIEQLHWEQGL